MSITKKMQTRNFVAVAAVVGLAVSPVVASAATDNTTVTATVGSTISMSSSGAVNVNLTPTASGVVSSASDTVSVSTNNGTGYNLTLASTDASNALSSGGNSIAAHAGTQAAPSTLTNNTWGYAVAGVGGFGASYSAENNNGSSSSTWAGVPTSGSPVTLTTTSAPASGDTTTVWYGVRVNSTQPEGSYSDSVTYTATTN